MVFWFGLFYLILNHGSDLIFEWSENLSDGLYHFKGIHRLAILLV